MAVFTATKVPAILLSPTEVPRDGCRREDAEGAWEYVREVRVRVLGFEVVKDAFARYVALVTAPARRWKVRKRFREFVALGRALQLEAPGEPWPALPPKRFFVFRTPKFESSFLEERARALDRWLKAVMRVPGALELASVRKFFDIADFSLDQAAAQNLRMIFDVLDAKGDGEGRLDREQIREAASMIGVCVSDAVLDMAMAEMDLTGDGLISFDEFKAIDFIFGYQDDAPPPPPPEEHVDMHHVDPAAQGSAELGGPGEPEAAILYTSSTNASVVAEAEERRIKHILTTKGIRYEIVYLDITMARRDELHEAICRTTFEDHGAPPMVAQNAFVPIPRLVVRGKDVGGYAEIQALEDDRLLDEELADVPQGEPFWTPPDEWDDEDRDSEEDHLRKVFERLGVDDDENTNTRRLTTEGMSAALALMGVASPLVTDSPQGFHAEWPMESPASPAAPAFEEGQNLGYDEFLDWYEQRSEVRLFEYLDDQGNGALGPRDVGEAARVLGGSVDAGDIDALMAEHGRAGEEASVDVLDFLAWWAKHKAPQQPHPASPRRASRGCFRSPEAHVLRTPEKPRTRGV